MSSEQQQSTSSTSAPWKPQQPYLKQAFQGAQDAYTQAQGAQAPTDFTAQFTPDQINAFTQMLNYGTGNGQIAQSSANAGSTLTSAGANGATTALDNLNNFTPQGGTQSNVDAANKYVAGLDIPGQVAADMLPAEQAASDETLPSLARQAAGSGNINSSRLAIQQGLVERGLAQQGAADATNLTNNAYNTGLGLAEQGRESDNASQLSSIIAALTGGTNAAATGVNANTGAVNQQGGIFNIANAGVAGQNTAAQAPLTNEQQQFTSETNSPFAALQNFYNIIGANNWGGTQVGTSTGTSTPSPFQTIGGLLGAVGSFF